MPLFLATPSHRRHQPFFLAMLKRKKKNIKIDSGLAESAKVVVDQQIDESNAEQVEAVMSILKGGATFYRRKSTKWGSDTLVVLKLDEAMMWLTVSVPTRETGLSKAAAKVKPSPETENVFIVDVHGVIKGQGAWQMRDKDLKKLSACSMTIQFSTDVIDESAQLDLYLTNTSAQADAVMQAWTNGLTFLMEHSLETFFLNPVRVLIAKGWTEASSHGGIRPPSLERWLNARNYNITKKQLRVLFQTYDADGSGHLGEVEFTKLLLQLSRSHLVEKMYADATGESSRLKGAQLKAFMDVFQGDASISVEECSQMVKKVTGISAGFELEDFGVWMTDSSENSVIHPTAHTVYQNMTHPFNHYYISTTRIPRADTISYLNVALGVGCRAFHIEVYSEGGEPSLSKPGFPSVNVPELDELFSTMRDKCFQTSKYPVIFIFELHCRDSVQQKLATMLKTFLGFGLNKDFENCTPEDCKERFLVVADASQAGEGESATVHKALKELCTFEMHPFQGSLGAIQKQFEANKAMAGKQIMRLKDAHLELNMEKGEVFTNFNDKALSYWIPRNETTNSFAADAWALGVQMVGINLGPQQAPKGKGGDTQQGQDANQQLAQLGRFAQNGRCGYVLKPSTCRLAHVDAAEKWRRVKELQEAKNAAAALGGGLQEDTEKDPLEKDDVLDYNDGTGSAIMKIRLLGANRLPKLDKNTISSVYLYLKIIGCKADEKEFRSSVVEENGYCPQWHDDFELTVEQKELDILCLKIYEKGATKDNILGQAAIPLPCLRNGYRNIELRNESGLRIASHPTLFLKIAQEVCGSFQSLKAQEAAVKRSRKKVIQKCGDLMHEIDTVRNAAVSVETKQAKLEKQTSDYKNQIEMNNKARVCGIWFNQKKIGSDVKDCKACFANCFGLGDEEDEDEEEDEDGKKQDQKLGRDDVFRQNNYKPHDQPTGFCDCLTKPPALGEPLESLDAKPLCDCVIS